MNKEKLVFEIGVEEIPTQYIKTMANSLKENSLAMLNDARLSFNALEVYYTPRRFVLIVEGLSNKQLSEDKLIKGPAVNIAFEPDGKTPTAAFNGFLSKTGKKVKDSFIVDDGKHQFVAVKTILEGQDTISILPQKLGDLVKAIYCPNSMRWGNYKIRFVRPIRWILALYGETQLSVDIECATSSHYTYGHRTLSSEAISVLNANDYEGVLKKNYVILREEDRKSIIRSQIAKIESEMNFEVELDEKLLDEVANIVEYPTCAVGSFDVKYLNLPECIIKSPLKTQQRYFPVYQSGAISNYFVYVRNGGKYMIDNVTRGNERVLRPRLADGEFFFHNDCNTMLSEFANRLDSIVFVDKAGSYKDKVKRVDVIATKLASLLKYTDLEKVHIAVSILKADLLTSVVREYTDIQGEVGGVLAQREGYSPEICTAISEQYLPNFVGDRLPSNRLSSIIAIADKLDSILCVCASGLKPKGSADPYGLRRLTLGIYLIAYEQGFDFDLDSFIKDISYLYSDYVNESGDNLGSFNEFIHVYFLQRLRIFLHEVKGVEQNIIEKISINELNISKSIKKAEMIAEYGKTDWYQKFILVFNRMQKLIKNEDGSSIFSLDIVDDEAYGMFDSYYKVKDEILYKIKTENYKDAIILIADCGEAVNDFLENHLALCNDTKKRENRIAFFREFCFTCGSIIQLAN